MANLYTVSAGSPIADEAARHILSQVTGDARARAVVFVPTRRAAVSMRAAFSRALAGEASLLPRILPLADIGEGLLTLLGPKAVDVLETIPPAMSRWQQQYLLAAQIRRFLEQRHTHVALDYPLALAEDLVALEDQCARAGVALTPEALRNVVRGGMATHWEQSLEFLNILAVHWPGIEQAMGMTTATRREILVMDALARAWRASPPDHAVFAVGSTASQESTAVLLEIIAHQPHGAVILPGIDTAMPLESWNAIESGHPLFHLKHFLDRFPCLPSQLIRLGEAENTVWSCALASAAHIPDWAGQALARHEHLTLIPCTHAEQEARVIALLMREALETPEKRTALITPDEGLMTRVAAQMKRYGIRIDRLERGTLAQSDAGSLWSVLAETLLAPERLMPLRSLLHHRLLRVDTVLLSGLEPAWYGVSSRRPGQMPKLPEAVRMQEGYVAVELLVRQLAKLSRARLVPSEWVRSCSALLMPFFADGDAITEGVEEGLQTLAEADLFGPVELPEFVELLYAQLAEPMRHGGVAAHPQLVMLTPVEARMEHFDRVILGSMTETVWPGIPQPNAWLNMAAQASLGLAPATHQVSLVAHDMLMLGSAPEVFLSWPARDQGSPSTRSRFIERLVTFLSVHGIEEETITARHYPQWADMQFAGDSFAPSEPPQPRPLAIERPTRLPVSALDQLFSDPYAIYARYILNLRKLDAIDADVEASDFGSLAHRAIQALTLHWNAEKRAANSDELAAIAERALYEFSERPSTGLFWRNRLIRALAFVNTVEEERRQEARTVTPEVVVEQSLPLAKDQAITLHGRIDRLESLRGRHVIGDYKTGEIPTEKKIRDGAATQLLAYAMLATDVNAIEYWRLPHARHEGTIMAVPYAELEALGLPEQLKAGLRRMLDADVPFLANPGRIRDYDGITRYDEWAG